MLFHQLMHCDGISSLAAAEAARCFLSRPAGLEARSEYWPIFAVKIGISHLSGDPSYLPLARTRRHEAGGAAQQPPSLPPAEPLLSLTHALAVSPSELCTHCCHPASLRQLAWIPQDKSSPAMHGVDGHRHVSSMLEQKKLSRRKASSRRSGSSSCSSHQLAKQPGMALTQRPCYTRCSCPGATRSRQAQSPALAPQSSAPCSSHTHLAGHGDLAAQPCTQLADIAASPRPETHLWTGGARNWPAAPWHVQVDVSVCAVPHGGAPHGSID